MKRASECGICHTKATRGAPIYQKSGQVALCKYCRAIHNAAEDHPKKAILVLRHIANQRKIK